PSNAVDKLNLKNGKVWTGDLTHSEVDGFTAHVGRVYATAIGTRFARIRDIDLEGKRVVPGFYDSHVHLLGGGMRLSQVALKDAKDAAEFGKRLRDFDKK